MPKLLRLSGKEVVGIFAKFGFMAISQRGSHMKLKREINGQAQILTVPAHSELDMGTLRAIIRQASRYVSLEELKIHFYG